MYDWGMMILIGLLLFFGLTILERLPKTSRDSSFAFHLPDEWIALEIDNVMEGDFAVSYIDGWNVGREFAVYGKVLGLKDRERERHIEGLALKERMGATIHPSPDWFKGSRLGWLRVSEGIGGEMHLSIPHQLARAALDDLRRNPRQIAKLGIAKVAGKKGGTSYSVVSFDLLERYD